MSGEDEGSIFDALADMPGERDYPYYDRKGELIPRDVFLQLFEKPDYRVVKQEVVTRPFWAWLKGLFSGVTPREVFVSTVWLGINHNFDEKGPPIIFETMVFGGSNDEIYQERYATEEHAVANHEALVRYFRKSGRIVRVS